MRSVLSDVIASRVLLKIGWFCSDVQLKFQLLSYWNWGVFVLHVLYVHVMLYLLSQRFCEVIRFRLRQNLEYLFAFCNQLQLTNPFAFVPTSQEPSCVKNAQKPSSTPRSCRPKRLKWENRKLLNMITIYAASLFLECFDRNTSIFCDELKQEASIY